MVDLAMHEKKVQELERFFIETISNPNNLNTTSSGAGAEYGLECVLGIKKAIHSYNEKSSNKQLKNIFYGFTAISRGVESFVDYDLENSFRKVSKGIYSLQEDLKIHIKW
ncbi:hypothetical protein [Persicobacter psychrovividus]|uniref:Uncharacterized protein n=1 Tax=Persicobacter psychrovividus TaxID=387638 RepID=A0ABM7VD23_9BACT|nr:hypothetical protein PEPS_11160 [Persicobacter psychrovividus]